MEKSKRDLWAGLSTVKSFDLGPSDSHLEMISQTNSQQIEIINSNTTTPISLLIQSLVQQLCSLLEKDPLRAEQLYTTICEKLHSMNLIDDSYSMGEFEVMRSQYQRALYQLVTVASGSEVPISLPSTWPIVQPSGMEWSRYHREFEELFFIAGGGFGSVFKAKHRLDGVEYAVKKVYIRSADVNSILTHLAEVKTIASLNHPNIVNYKAAWLEPMIESARKKKKRYRMEMDSDVDLTFSKSSVHPDFITSFKTHNSKELYRHESQSDFVISFKNNSQENSTSDGEYMSDSEDSTQPEDNALCKYMDCGGAAGECSRVNLKWATLYIQMTFCPQTLKQWLDERNARLISSSQHLQRRDSESDLDESAHVELLTDMFAQLVHGLHYIHARGVIHHDVKPSNVFVSGGAGEGAGAGVRVQLGDFGLACPLQREHSGLALGTHLYAAPEQLEGHCNPKSDMYSLGIILLELLEPFSTDMERVKTIADLRKGQLPAHLTANHPKLAHIIGKLVQRRPGKRLDTAQLLEELKLLAENKDETIKSLREELAAKEDEIKKLKLMLAQINYKS